MSLSDDDSHDRVGAQAASPPEPHRGRVWEPSQGSDHREVAQRLDLLHFQDEAPGMVFWHPRGFALYRCSRRRPPAGAQPGLPRGADAAAPAAPGVGGERPLAALPRGMFRVEDQAVPAAVKPVSCPGHMLPVRRGGRRRTASCRCGWRELGAGPPRRAQRHAARAAAPAPVHAGRRPHLLRGGAGRRRRSLRFCRSLPAFYRAFGFDDVSAGALDAARAARRRRRPLGPGRGGAASRCCSGWACRTRCSPGAGAFYGPKLEFVAAGPAGPRLAVRDDPARPGDARALRPALRRTPRASARPPVMLHRALLRQPRALPGRPARAARRRRCRPGWRRCRWRCCRCPSGQAAGAGEWADAPARAGLAG